MKLLFLSSLWPPHALGGAELYASELAGRLREAGHEVGVVTMGVAGPEVVASARPWPYRLDQFAHQPAWRRAAFRAVDLYNPEAVVRVRAAVRAANPDVVHSHSVIGMSAAAMALPAGVPRVHHLHDHWLVCRRATMAHPSGQACRSRCASCRLISTVRSAELVRRPPDLMLAPSRDVMDRHSALSWAAGRLRLLRHPVSPPPPRRRARPAAGSALVFGYLGQLNAAKGVDVLAEAFSRPPSDAPGRPGPLAHRLVVAGSGPMSGLFSGSGPSVEHLGWLDGEDRERFWEAIDCLVVPSRWPEIGPLVAMEATARGVPVIGSDIGGIPEHVGPRSRALLVPPGDPLALSGAMARFASDPPAYSDPPARSQPASWSQHVTALEELYREAVSRAGKGS